MGEEQARGDLVGKAAQVGVRPGGQDQAGDALIDITRRTCNGRLTAAEALGQHVSLIASPGDEQGQLDALNQLLSREEEKIDLSKARRLLGFTGATLPTAERLCLLTRRQRIEPERSLQGLADVADVDT